MPLQCDVCQCIKDFVRDKESFHTGVLSVLCDILGNSISYFFTQEDVFDELCKLLFVNQEFNIEIVSETFHESSLPNNSPSWA